MKSNQENQMTAKWRSRALALALSLGACITAFAQNAIQSINSSQQAGSEVLRVELSEALPAVPAGFAIQTPPRIAIDLPGVANALGKNSVEVNQGNLRDGMVTWGNGKRSWLAREGPGVLVGDVDTGKHFYFRRNG